MISDGPRPADREETCAHCGLPLPRPWFARRTRPSDAPEYCCLGCSIAARVAGSNDDQGAAHWMLAKLGLAIFCTMNVMVFTMVLWTCDVYDARPSEAHALAPALEELFRYTCLVSAMPVLLLLGAPLAESAWRQLRRGALGVDLLLLAGVVASFSYSTWAVLTGRPQIYFEVGCVVLVAVTLGRWFEVTIRLGGSRALDQLAHLLPERARWLHDGVIETIAAEELRPGDVFRVLAGERVPADGILLHGEASIDEQFTTGESVPVRKRPGDGLVGGALNLDGTLDVQATAAAAQGSLAAIVEAVRTAKLAGGHYQQLADRVARWFGLGVALLASATFGGWWLRVDFPTAILNSLAVLLIACPCALAVATPMAVWMAIQQAARRKIVFRSGEALERLARVEAVCFDKTGTLTTGIPASDHLVRSAELPESMIDALLVETAAQSVHPLARALARDLRALGGAPAHDVTLRSARTVSGRGVVAELQLDGRARDVALGDPDWISEFASTDSPALLKAIDEARFFGSPVLALACEGRLMAVARFREQLRSGACEAIAWLRRRHFELGILSGDRAARASCIARELGIAVEDGLSPLDKADRLRGQRRRTAMVGDGVNDAPALARSYVGVSLASGADLARDTAGVCLLGDDLRNLPEAIELAQHTVRIVRQNLFWALFYNAIGISFAMAGWMSPVVAAVAMVGSSALVLVNSQRLRDWRPTEESSDTEFATIEALGRVQGDWEQDPLEAVSAQGGEP